MQAFILRPFGKKSHGAEGGSREIDFDEIERKLIAPALTRENIQGRTTMEILQAGDIRVDMFRRLLTADVVIADLTIHNANVFYELGVRHALRKSKTLLISGQLDKHVFDLGPERYMPYSLDTPETFVDELAARIRRTLRSPETDSPVFRMNQGLKEPDVSDFVFVPQRFSEDVDLAAAGPDAPLLALMSEEIQELGWAREGRRIVARAQRKIEDLRDAVETWEKIRAEVDDDIEANLELSTLYDRLGEPVKSQLALDRALRQSAETKIKAETEALIARNSKTVWIREWSTEEHLQNRQRRALESPYLEESAKRYEKGFLRNLNQFYPGINALGLYRVQYELAIRHADSWASKFEDASDAEPVLRKLGQKLETIAHAVRQSLVAAQGLEEGDPDVWRIITDADLFLLTSDNVNFVKTKYREAKATCAQINNDDRFAANAAARQLQLYIKLGVLEENAKAGLEAIGAPSEKEESPQYDRVLVFVGHQIDAPGRAPRFPAACEEKARQGIRARVAHYLESANGGRLVGFAGAASGGDILFHEVCVELGVETRMLVGVPERVHIREALSPANGDWLDRYRRLAQKVKPRFLSESDELPTWLEERTSRYTPLLRTSLWFIKTANSVPAVQYTLLALWDGEKGTGTGGTGDMVELAERNGFAKDIIDTAQVFGQSLSLPA